MRQIKSCQKSELREDGGSIVGYASTFDRDPDSYGDVIAKGAFAKSLERWAALNEEGRYIPLLWGHDMEDPKSNIGRIIEAYEDERGLFVRGEFDADNEKAQYVRKLAQEGRVYQFSFAFEILDQGEVKLEDGRKANELRELELFEVSIVQIPANQHATVEDVKSIEAKAGRRNSKADEDALRHVVELAESVSELSEQIQDEVMRLVAVDDTDSTDDEQPSEEVTEGEEAKAMLLSEKKEAIKIALGVQE